MTVVHVYILCTDLQYVLFRSLIKKNSCDMSFADMANPQIFKTTCKENKETNPFHVNFMPQTPKIDPGLAHSNIITPVREDGVLICKRYSSPKEIDCKEYPQKPMLHKINNDNSHLVTSVTCDHNVCDEDYDEDCFEAFLKGLDEEDKIIHSSLNPLVNYSCNDTLDDEISKLESTLLELESDETLKEVDPHDDVENFKLVLDLPNSNGDKINVDVDAIVLKNDASTVRLEEIVSTPKTKEALEKTPVSVKEPMFYSNLMWKPKLLFPTQSYYILDEYGEVSDGELSSNRGKSPLHEQSPLVLRENVHQVEGIAKLVSTSGNIIKKHDNTVEMKKGKELSFSDEVTAEDTLKEDNPVGIQRSKETTEVLTCNENNANLMNTSQNIEIICPSLVLKQEIPLKSASNTHNKEYKLNENKGIIPKNTEVNNVPVCDENNSNFTNVFQNKLLPFPPLHTILETTPKPDSNIDCKSFINRDIENMKIDMKVLTTDNLLVRDERSEIKSEFPGNASVKSEEKPDPSKIVVYQENVIQPADEDFVSNDPQENEDNNNPKWEVLRKLETDDERYKAVRERWRSLVIPHPNQNLTYLHRRHKTNKVSSSGASTSKSMKIPEPKGKQNNSRKRTRTMDPTLSNTSPKPKRARTQSCTTIFDRKVEELQRTVENQKLKLLFEERQAMKYLGVHQTAEHLQLMCSNNTQYGFMILRDQLYQKHLEDVAVLRHQYASAQLSAEAESQSKMAALMKAMEEVRAFHSFYQGLDANSADKDCLLLSDMELEDVLDNEMLDEQYKSFYSQ